MTEFQTEIAQLKQFFLDVMSSTGGAPETASAAGGGRQVLGQVTADLIHANERLSRRVKTLEAALLVYAERENWTAINNGDDETDDDERWFVKDNVKHGWQIAAAAISASDQQT